MRLFIFLLVVLLSSLSYAQVDSLKQVLEDKPKDQETVRWINRTISSYWQSNPEAMETMGRIALDMAREIGFRNGEAISQNSIGISYWARDLYEVAMEHYLAALTIHKELGDLKGAATLSINIGTIYDELEQTENAKDYTLKGLKYFEQLNESIFISRSQLNLGVIYFSLKQYDSALFFFKQVEVYREQVNDTLGMGLVYNNIAAVLQAQKKLEASTSYYQRARAITSDDRKNLLSDIYGGLTFNYLMSNQQNIGMQYADSALQLSDELGLTKLKQVTHEHLKDYYAQNGRYKEALNSLEKVYELDKEIRGEEIQTQIERLSQQYESEKKEKQLAILEKESAQNQFYLIIVILSGVFIAIAAGLVINLLRLRIKNSRLKERDLKAQLEQKNRELTSYALNFIQKNELMGELTERINELKKQSDPGTVYELNKINKIVSNSFRIDQDWENFRLMFEEVHQGYLPALKEEFGDLSNADLKLCALLRLNLNLKESSRILGISPDSVKIARYRLRKKLNLATEDNLVDFLILFDTRRLEKAVA